MTSNQDINRYYDENQVLYDFFWSRNALHYGMWNKKTKNISEAILNTDKFILNRLKINSQDTVLDAGCGVGGTSIFIAENSGAKVFGITLSAVHLRIAKEQAIKSKASKSLYFSKQDFTKTQFKNNTFSKIFGIESICHAHKKIYFLKEAYRIMKPGGRLAVVDAYLTRTDFNEKDMKTYQKVLTGWALPNLSSKEDFYRDLDMAGFKNIKFCDKLDSVKKSSKKIHQLGTLAYPITFILSRLKIIPISVHGNSIASVNQKKMVDEHMVTYGAFVAEK